MVAACKWSLRQVSLYFNIHYFLPLILFIYLMTAAHEEIATGGQIRGVGESDQQTLSK